MTYLPFDDRVAVGILRKGAAGLCCPRANFGISPPVGAVAGAVGCVDPLARCLPACTSRTPASRRSGSVKPFALAPRVLIKEATADVEILVIAGWQSGPLVPGKPLREGDHPGGWRRRSARCRPLRLGAVILPALANLLSRGVLPSVRPAAPGCRRIGGSRRMPARAAPAAHSGAPASGAVRCRLAQVDGGTVVLLQHRDQPICLAGDLVN